MGWTQWVGRPIHLATSKHTYPYQGIQDAINSAQRKIQQMAENIKIEVLNNFDRNIKLMEDACSAILLEILPLKNLPNNMTYENQSNSNIQVTMMK